MRKNAKTHCNNTNHMSFKVAKRSYQGTIVNSLEQNEKNDLAGKVKQGKFPRS